MQGETYLPSRPWLRAAGGQALQLRRGCRTPISLIHGSNVATRGVTARRQKRHSALKYKVSDGPEAAYRTRVRERQQWAADGPDEGGRRRSCLLRAEGPAILILLGTPAVTGRKN